MVVDGTGGMTEVCVLVCFCLCVCLCMCMCVCLGLKVTFRRAVAIRPKKANAEDLYFCPFCGGLRRERCTECYGSGVVRKKGEEESGKGKVEPDGFIEDPSMGYYEESEKFGVKIWRKKKKPGRTPKKEKEEEATEAPKTTKEGGRRGKGRPRRSEQDPFELPGLVLPTRSSSSEDGQGTDFISRTSFQIQQELIREEIDEETPDVEETDGEQSPDVP